MSLEPVPTAGGPDVLPNPIPEPDPEPPKPDPAPEPSPVPPIPEPEPAFSSIRCDQLTALSSLIQSSHGRCEIDDGNGAGEAVAVP